MLRWILTLLVGAALLVGIGAWFDPEGAREAIQKDLEGIAGKTVDEVEGVVRDAAQQAVAVARERLTEPPKPAPGSGPRGKKPPVVARAAPEPEVEEVVVETPSDFVESEPAAEAIGAVEVASSEPAPLAEETPDLGSQGQLIRRMLALYARVSERR